MTDGTSKRKSSYNWLESLMVYRQPRVIGMLFLGFSAGLPLLLIFSTLNTWLRDVGVSRTEIGFFAWVGLAFSIKVLWAPLVDHIDIPFLWRLGKRRSWMLLGQFGIIVGLIGMAFTDPTANLAQMAAFSVVVAFSSATQDIGLDAYRIEAMDTEYQGAMSANYVMGYRIAMLVAGAGSLYLADFYSWILSYQVMALLMGVGIITVFVIKEPDREEALEGIKPFDKSNSYIDQAQTMVLNPFVDFFKRNGWIGGFILAFIGAYKISDIIMGNMANPLYIDLGFSKSEIASISKVFGLIMTIFGGYVGGMLLMRFGLLPVLLLGAILVCLTNVLFAILAQVGYSLDFLTLTITADNFSNGVASAVFIAYLSSLVNKSYTATQYALFSSFMTLPGKFISGFSGVIIDHTDYTTFFLYAAGMGIPAIIMVIGLMIYDSRQKSDENLEKPTVETVQ